MSARSGIVAVGKLRAQQRCGGLVCQRHDRPSERATVYTAGTIAKGENHIAFPRRTVAWLSIRTRGVRRSAGRGAERGAGLTACLPNRVSAKLLAGRLGGQPAITHDRRCDCGGDWCG